MKIGILTYHWATNYGAVLQAIALQDYLIEIFPNDEVSIVDYIPRTLQKSFWKCFKTKHIFKVYENLLSLKKEKKLDSCRKEKMVLSERCFDDKCLSKTLKYYDVLIVGSDQVWSPFFAVVSSVYYLMDENITARKIAYAASFGVYDFSRLNMCEYIHALKSFNAISVREEESVVFLSRENINAKIVPDPTLLWNMDYYERRYNLTDIPSGYRAFFLRGLTEHKKQIVKSILNVNDLQENELLFIDENSSLEEWLSHIKSAKLMITNSYHCMIMCIQFKIPFYVIGEDGVYEEMNNRFKTLLTKLPSINEYFVCDVDQVKKMTEIDWETIENSIDVFKNVGKHYLETNI